MRRSTFASPTPARTPFGVLGTVVLALCLGLGLLAMPVQTSPASAAVPYPGKFTAVSAKPGPGVGELTVSWTQDGTNTTGYSLETGMTSFSPSSTSLPVHGRDSKTFAIADGKKSVTLTAAQVTSAGAPVASANHVYYRLKALNHTSAGDQPRNWPYLQVVEVQPAVPATTGVALRIASFNVRTARATGDSQTWLQRAPEVAKAIVKANPGVEGLQELGPGRADGQPGTLGGTARQTDSLVTALKANGGSKYKLVRTTPYVSPYSLSDTQGTRILYDTTRYTLLTSCPDTTGSSSYSSSCSIALPIRSSGDTESNRRRAAYAEFEDKSTGVRFFYVSVHLDARSSDDLTTQKSYEALRTAESKAAIAGIAKLNTKNEPVVFSGDLNSWQNNQVGFGAHDALIAAGYYDTAAATKTVNDSYTTSNDFQTTIPKSPSGYGARIDVLAVKGVIGASYWENVMKVTDNQRPSDHNMIYADIKLPQVSASHSYQALTPSRLLDTRIGVGAPKAIVKAGATVSLSVTGLGGVPTSGVSAVVLNVTATGSTAGGYATVFPAGVTRPTASTLNFGAQQTVANGVPVKVGTGGKVSLYVSSSTHLVVDVEGWFPTGSDLHPLTPARLLDTRTGLGGTKAIVAADGQVDLAVLDRGGVPPYSVSSVVLNVTSTGSTKAGYVTAFPSGVARPRASTLNFDAGRTVANGVVVKVGTDGKVSLYVSSATQLVVDVEGWFPTGSDTVALTPSRLLDTRTGVGAAKKIVPDSGVIDLAVTGHGGVPTTGVSAVVLNVTATGPVGAGYVTVFPSGVTRPRASTLNYAAGQTVANNVIVKVGSGGKVSLFASRSTHLVADVVAYIKTS